MTKYEKNLIAFQKSFSKRSCFCFIKKLRQQFSKAEVYLVGGAIRDIALGVKNITDYDFVVRHVRPRTLERFLKKHGVVNLVGKTFGVLKFVPKNGSKYEPFDIALPRTEHSLGDGGGYRDFEVQSDPKMEIEEDLGRRDFTINAMAVKLTTCNLQLAASLVDPFGGLKDLQKRVIRAVGKPQDRFKEDYSRMLRAIRFACQLNFDIEGPTLTAIKKIIKHINDTREDKFIVPRETIAKEMLKAFYENPVKAFDLYDQAGAFKQLMPEALKMKGCPQPDNWHTEGDVWEHTRLCLTKLISPQFKKRYKLEKPSALLIMAALFHDLGKPYTLRTPEKHGTDRIRFNEHDLVGAKMACEFCHRLKLSSMPENTPLRIDCQKLGWLISKHMLLTHAKKCGMKHSTVEKYFFNPEVPGQELIQLSYVDIASTVPRNGRPDFSCLRSMMKQIDELKKLPKSKEEKGLPKPILNGHEIMKKFKIEPGVQIGKLLAALREKQLAGRVRTKRDGFGFLRRILKS